MNDRASSDPDGTLVLAARRSGERTILERVRYDGISRCSRAFRQGDAALVVLSQLGPGVVRGDAVATRGYVGAGAHLIVTAQSATRLMGGARSAHARAEWSVGEAAVLELIGEPLLANADAAYEASTVIDLAAGACVLASELASIPAGARVRVRMSIARAGREVFYDGIDASAAAPQSVGSIVIAGVRSDRVTSVVAALDEATDHLPDAGLRTGVGALPCGAFARVLGADPWAVREGLAVLREALRGARRAYVDVDGVAS